MIKSIKSSVINLFLLVVVFGGVLTLQSCDNNNETVKQIRDTELSDFIEQGGAGVTSTFDESLNNCDFVEDCKWKVLKEDEFYQVIHLTIFLKSKALSFNSQVNDIKMHIFFKYSKTAVTFNRSRKMVYLDRLLLEYKEVTDKKTNTYRIRPDNFLITLGLNNALSSNSLINISNGQPVIQGEKE